MLKRIMRSKNCAIAVSMLGQVLIYAGVIAIYYSAVLNHVGGWLKRLFEHKLLYAIVALACICVQGILLEWLTAWLTKLLQRHRK